MAKAPPKPPVKKPAPKADTKQPPITQKSLDAAAKMNYEDEMPMKKAKGGKVNTCKKKCGGKVTKK